MRLLEKYEFEIDYDVLPAPVTPVNGDLVFQQTKEGAYYREEITTALIFQKSDFDYLKAINDGTGRCDKIPLNVYISGSPRVLHSTHYLNMNSGEWDYSKCTVSITPQAEDEYTCILSSSKEKKNILLAPVAPDVKTIIGEIEEEECTDTFIVWQGGVQVGDPTIPIDACLAFPANGWRVKEHHYIVLGAVNGVAAAIVKTIWVREKVTGLQPPGAWISESTYFVRAVSIIEGEPFVITELDGTLGTGESQVNTVSFSDVKAIDNGRTLKDVLEYLTTDCTLGIVSDFFTINPDNSYPTNAYYTKARTELNNVIIWQITDVTRANASENATIANVTLEDVLEDLAALFDLEWWVEGTDLRIEHVSFRQTTQGEDLTGNQRLVNTDKFNYKTDDLPEREVFTWPDSVSADFIGVPIEYGSCSTIDEKAYTIKTIITDFEHVIEKAESVKTDGLFLLAAAEYNSLLIVTYYANSLSGKITANGNMSWPNLQNDYYKYRRPQLTGIMNEVAVTFDNAFRTKVQSELSIVKSPTEYKAFNPEFTHQTGLGWGEVESTEYDAKTGVLTINLLHE